MKKERSEIIHDALNFLDDEMIEEVENLRAGIEVQQSRPRPWRKWTALAASICLLVVIGGVWQGVQGESHNENSNDMNMESVPESNLTDTDINQEHANDSVNDKYENLENEISNNKKPLSKGEEILEWLGFEVGAENYTILYEEKDVTDREIFDKFFASFAENDVVLRKDMSTKVNAEDIKHLYLITEEGVSLHFELLGNGYVSYYGLDEVCVKVNKRVYEIVIDWLEENK